MSEITRTKMEIAKAPEGVEGPGFFLTSMEKAEFDLAFAIRNFMLRN
jgi:hypothetical protein